MRSALVAVVLGSSFLWAGSAPKPVESLIITNVNVVDTRYGGILPNLTVVIEDGVVKAITKVAVIDVGPHVRVMNAAGRYLVAGFWDMNAQISGDSARAWDSKSLYALYLANGVIGVRESDGVNERMQLVSRLSEAASSPGQKPAPYQGFTLLRSPKDRAIADIYGFLRGCCSKPIQLFPAISDLSVPQDDEPPLPADIYDPDKTTDVFHEISDRGGWVIPGLVAVEAPIASISDADWNAIDDAFALDRSTPRIQKLLQQRARFRQALQLAREMARTGVRLLAGTNGPRAHLLPGRSLHRELQLLVKTGCTPFEALQSATFNAALYVAKGDRYGVVEPGHVADLVLLDANPLQDISNTQKIWGVILGGRWFSRSDLERLTAGLDQNDAESASTAAAASKPAE